MRTGLAAILTRLQNKEAELTERKKKLMKQFMLGRINDNELDDALKQIQTLLVEVKQQMQKHGKIANISSTDARIGNFVAAMQQDTIVVMPVCRRWRQYIYLVQMIVRDGMLRQRLM